MAIYDNKVFQDFYEVESEELQSLAAGVGIVCADGQPILTAHGLRPRTVQAYFRGVVVRGEELAYVGKQSAGTLVDSVRQELAVWMVGTAFAVARYQMLTAWHVVKDVLNEVDSRHAEDLRVVLGYSRRSSARSSPEYNVLRVARARQLSIGEASIDVGVLELKDPVPSDAILPIQTNAKRPRDSDPVTLIGYPLGQPLKISSGKIQDADPSGDRSSAHVRMSACFGNSGSPVIWKSNVIGVFTGGDWPSEFAVNSEGKWDHFYWKDESNGGAGYDGTMLYVGDII